MDLWHDLREQYLEFADPPDGPTFVLGLDGRAVAWTHGHGRVLRWFS